MAKTFEFDFSHFPIEYTDYGYTTTCGLMMAAPRERRTCTFAEAVAYLPEYGAKQAGAVTAHLHLAGQSRRERAPAGYNDERKTQWMTPRPVKQASAAAVFGLTAYPER